MGGTVPPSAEIQVSIDQRLSRVMVADRPRVLCENPFTHLFSAGRGVTIGNNARHAEFRRHPCRGETPRRR